MPASRTCHSLKGLRYVVVVAFLSASVQLVGQTPPSGYLVGPQDVLRASVFNEPDLTGVYTVDSDGTITFPLISRVSVEGLSLREIEDEITRKLADGFLVNPQVSIEIA